MFKRDSSSWTIRDVVLATHSAVGLVLSTFTVLHAGIGSLVSGQLDLPSSRPARLFNSLLAHLANTAGFSDKLAWPNISHNHTHTEDYTDFLLRQRLELLPLMASYMLGSSPG